MKIINNNPSVETAIGKICSTAHHISFQVENCLYLLPSIKEEMAEKVKEIIGNQMQIAKMTGDFLGSYTCTHLQKNLHIEDEGIQEAIEKEGCNAILPLSFPVSDTGKYLLVKLEEKEIQQQVYGIIYSSERHIRQETQKTLHKLLIDNPEEFKKWLEPLFSTPAFIKNFFTSAVHSLLNPTMGMVPQMSAIKEILGFKDDVVDFHQKAEMLKRITENVKKVRRNGDKKADAELTFLINSIPAEYIIEMLKNLTPSQLTKVTPYLDPEVYAENSRLRMEVCDPKKMEGYQMPTNKKIKNTGTYKLFLFKDGHFKAVDFTYKSSFIVYLIYLIDRYKQEDEIDPIDLLEKKWENEYYRLFNLIYPEHTDEAKSTYYTLVSKYKDKDSKEKKKKRLGDCYADIRKCVGTVCDELGEIISPHIIEDAGDHIATKPHNIRSPFKLL